LMCYVIYLLLFVASMAQIPIQFQGCIDSWGINCENRCDCPERCGRLTGRCEESMSSPPHPTTSKLAVKSEMSVGKSPGCDESISSLPHPITSKLAVKSETSVGKSPGCGMIGFNGTATPPSDLVSFRYSSLQWYDPTPVEKGDGRCHSSIRGDRGWKGLGKSPLGTGLANDDGRATFQAGCREYLLSHALSSLRVPVIPTTNLFLLPCLEDASIRDRNYEGTYYLYVGGVLERGVGRIHRLGQVLDESSFNEVCKLTHKGCDCSRPCFFNETAKKLGIMAGSWAAVGFVSLSPLLPSRHL
jgi:hypothetical protein